MRITSINNNEGAISDYHKQVLNQKVKKWEETQEYAEKYLEAEKKFKEMKEKMRKIAESEKNSKLSDQDIHHWSKEVVKGNKHFNRANLIANVLLRNNQLSNESKEYAKNRIVDNMDRAFTPTLSKEEKLKKIKEMMDAGVYDTKQEDKGMKLDYAVNENRMGGYNISRDMALTMKVSQTREKAKTVYGGTVAGEIVKCYQITKGFLKNCWQRGSRWSWKS